MRLALNDTPVARALARDGGVDVDAIETSGPKAAEASAAYPGMPLLLHVPVWDWSLAHPDAWNVDAAAARTLHALSATGAPWLSLHVGFSAATVHFRDGMKPEGPTLDRDATLRAMRDTLAAAPLSDDRPVLVENLDAQDGGAYDHVCDPGFLRELVDEADVGMLLDLAHAQVSASRMGMTAEAYLAALPLDRVRQVHLSGPRPKEPSGPSPLVDAHDVLRERDLELLDHVLERTAPWAVTLEYGRDAARVLEQLDLLRTRLR